MRISKMGIVKSNAALSDFADYEKIS